MDTSDTLRPIDISSISDEAIRKNEDGSFTLCGCGKPNCPTILSRPDGTMTMTDVVDGVEQVIDFDNEQTKTLYELLTLTYAKRSAP